MEKYNIVLLMRLIQENLLIKIFIL